MLTAQDVERISLPGKVTELIRGHLVVRERPGEVLAKVADWLAAGTELVWLVDPERSEVRVYRRDGSFAVVHAAESLDGEDVLPGFSCPLAQVFSWKAVSQ